MQLTSSKLTIGKLAKQAGVNIETVRHYQRKNLIQEPDKPEGGFRCYPYDTIEQIRFIKRAQQLGFSLKEIEQLLLLGSEHCHDVQALAREKSEMIKNQIKGLQCIQSALDDLIGSCKTDESAGQCAFIEALSHKGFLKE